MKESSLRPPNPQEISKTKSKNDEGDTKYKLIGGRNIFEHREIGKLLAADNIGNPLSKTMFERRYKYKNQRIKKSYRKQYEELRELGWNMTTILTPTHNPKVSLEGEMCSGSSRPQSSVHTRCITAGSLRQMGGRGALNYSVDRDVRENLDTADLVILRGNLDGRPSSAAPGSNRGGDIALQTVQRGIL